MTPDHVNPEAPWPELENLSEKMTSLGKCLTERLAIYPSYAVNHQLWIDPKVLSRLRQLVDQQGFAREDKWCAGEDNLPNIQQKFSSEITKDQNTPVTQILEKIASGCEADESEVVQLLNVRGEDFFQVCQAANNLRKKVSGETITYVVNRNINYTNVCNVYCKFCAFWRSEKQDDSYVITHDEIDKKIEETVALGGTQILMQGGHHPKLDKQWYLDLLSHIRAKFPQINIHAFSPSEFIHFRDVFDEPLEMLIRDFRDAGLGSIPGGGGEILVDEVRNRIAPLKAMSDDWLEVMAIAHKLDMATTATMMFGHVENIEHRVEHLERVRRQQDQTGGFTAFIAWAFQAENTKL